MNMTVHNPDDQVGRELQASAEMRDRIADMIGQFAAAREATRDTSRKGALLRAIEREVRKVQPCGAIERRDFDEAERAMIRSGNIAAAKVAWHARHPIARATSRAHTVTPLRQQKG